MGMKTMGPKAQRLDPWTMALAVIPPRGTMAIRGSSAAVRQCPRIVKIRNSCRTG